MSTEFGFKLLSKEEIGTIYTKAVEILANQGVKVQHPQALKLLAKAGAQVDSDSQQVRFPRDIIESALRTVPHGLTMASRKEENDCVVPHPKGAFYVRNDSGNPNFIEPLTGAYRPTTLADVVEQSQLIELLEEINCCSFPFPRDMPLETADIHALKALFENTSKHIIVQPYSFESIGYMCQLAEVVAGSKEALKKRPSMSLIACPLTPLTLEAWCTEVIIQGGKYGLPIQASCLPSAGGTAPITIAGITLLYAVEVLAILTISQIFTPGLSVTGVPIFFALDMVTGRIGASSVETMLAIPAAVQFIKEAYHIPTRADGLGTDSPLSDGQCSIQKSLKGLLTTLAGTDTICGAGQVDNFLATSPVQLVADNTLAKVLKRMTAGVKVTDDTLAWKEISAIAPGGHFLEQAHTARHCRESLRTELFINKLRDVWVTEGSKDLYARARDKYFELKKQFEPQPLSGEVKRELSNIVKLADKRLVK